MMAIQPFDTVGGKIKKMVRTLQPLRREAKRLTFSFNSPALGEKSKNDFDLADE